ncbi:MAG TPA: hypothetical protein DE179_02855 [Oceanospirillaceae bacterium]|nr:hypothetical protein [Oceanospirillaceae bacterium]
MIKFHDVVFVVISDTADANRIFCTRIVLSHKQIDSTRKQFYGQKILIFQIVFLASVESFGYIADLYAATVADR